MTTINVLLTTFAGLGLPPTLCLPLSKDASITHLLNQVGVVLPAQVLLHATLIAGNGQVIRSSSNTIATLLQSTCVSYETPTFLPLRLHAPLRGGKGGFGSQLRAAGGRMSSRKKKQNAELATGSARNLDGRRLRTITEAKNLAAYLATKPDMDRKEKEERRKRWEAVVDLAEQREADMRSGKTVDGRRKGLSSEWLEEKEEVGDSVKNALKLAIAPNNGEVAKLESDDSAASAPESADEHSEAEDPMELDEDDMIRLRLEAEGGDADAIWVLQNKLKIPNNLLPKPKSKALRFAGFDDDLSDSESDDDATAVAEER